MIVVSHSLNGKLATGILPTAVNRARFHLRNTGYLIQLEGVDNNESNTALLEINKTVTDTSLIPDLSSIVSVNCRVRTVGIPELKLSLNIIVKTSDGPRILLGTPLKEVTDTYTNLSFNPLSPQWVVVKPSDSESYRFDHDINQTPKQPLDDEYKTATLTTIRFNYNTPEENPDNPPPEENPDNPPPEQNPDNPPPEQNPVPVFDGIGQPVGPIVFLMSGSGGPSRVEFAYVELVTTSETQRYQFN